MNADWFYSDGEKRLGPVTEDELRRLARDGQLKPTDLVWRDGMPDWVEARTEEILFLPYAEAAPAAEDRPSRRRFDDDRGRDDADDERPRVRGDDGSDDEDRPRIRRTAEDLADDAYDRPSRRRGRGVPADVQGTKLAAGLLAIFLGWLGVHKFYLGFTTAGVIYIVMTVVGWILTIVSCGILFFLPMVPSVLSLIEGIIYLTKSDREFYELYVVRQKEWF